MALDNFRVEWDTDKSQSFFEDSEERDRRDAVPDSPIKHFFSWYEMSSAGRKRSIGSRFRYLFYTKLGLPDEDEWRYERPMGRGTFGAAALFSKVNDRQERTDALVLKVTEVGRGSLVKPSARKSHLTTEAAIMGQINEVGSDVLLKLRQYKVDQIYCRYYTEFCEYGNLEILRMRYKAWNQHFPELFLWHVFHCLAEAYLEFVRGPWRSMEERDFGRMRPGQYFLHNDIKTDNIFLATNPARDDTLIWYPKPKVGDFGLSVTTHANDRNKNHAKAMFGGSPAWQAPEHRYQRMTDYRAYYFRQDIHPELRARVGLGRQFHRIRPEANIWAIGAVMWTLVTLGEIDELDDRVNNILKGQNNMARSFDGTNILKRPDPEIKARYSPELWDLITECTRMKPDDRPPPSRLLSDIDTALAQCMQREGPHIEQTGDTSRVKVAFQENQIDNFPDGGNNFSKHMNFWNDFADHLLWVPKEWGPLCPPEMPSKDVNFNVEGVPIPLMKRQAEQWEALLQERNRRAAAKAAAEVAAAAAHAYDTPQSSPRAPIFGENPHNRPSDEGQPSRKRQRMS